ncbi:hypothetical protein [Clostridium sp. 19966]|uniref:hypothetical protein n=1 Tax=Clostridium sp. 19966 TaxID=2768166 RepID=UPI0037C07C4F
MNIDTFSKLISEKYNISGETLRDYIFANLSVGISRNKSLINEIEKIYKADKARYYNAIINSSSSNHIIMKQGTLSQEIQGRKVLGLFIEAERDGDLRSKLIKILRRNYNIVYNAVKKKNNKELKDRYIKMDEITRSMESKLDAAIYFYFSIYCSPEEVDQGYIGAIINDIINFESLSPMKISIENELNRDKDKIQEIKNMLQKHYGKLSSYKDVLNSETDFIEQIGAVIENILLINKLDIKHLLKNSEYIDIDKIILAVVKRGYSKLDSKEIMQQIVIGIFIQSLLNEYKDCRNIYFSNCQENLYLKLDSLEYKVETIANENLELKNSTLLLKADKDNFKETFNNEINKITRVHKAEIVNMEYKIKELEKKLEEEKKYRNELNSLQEYIFSISNDYEPTESDISLEKFINNKQILIIGGPKDWRRKIRDKYPTLRTLNGFNENFEIRVLNNADCVFFYTGFMSHSTYNRAMNFIRVHEIKFGYIGKTNIELVEREIAEELINIYEKKNNNF